MTRVGQVLAPFGVEGAVKVYSLTDFGDRFDAGAELHLAGVTHRVEWSRARPSGLVVKLVGVDNRTAAELLRGRYLEVPASQTRQLGEGSFYHHQLVGLEVFTESGERVGVLSQVLERPANDVWVAEEGSVQWLIPAVRDAVRKVDLRGRRVTIADWLLKEA